MQIILIHIIIHFWALSWDWELEGLAALSMRTIRAFMLYKVYCISALLFHNDYGFYSILVCIICCSQHQICLYVAQQIFCQLAYKFNAVLKQNRTYLVELRDRIGDPIMIGRFLDFFPIISDPRFLSVRSGIGRFLCVCTIYEKYQ